MYSLQSRQVQLQTMTSLSFPCLFTIFLCLSPSFPHIYHGFVDSMVALYWRLHSDHDSLPNTWGAWKKCKIGGHTIISILHTLIPIVFMFLVETSFLAGQHWLVGLENRLSTFFLQYIH